MKLIFAYHNKLVVMDKTGKTVRQLTNASDASGVDFHLNKEFIYLLLMVSLFDKSIENQNQLGINTFVKHDNILNLL